MFALNKGYRSSDAVATQAILDALAATGRYSLSVDFMTSEEEAAQIELLKKMSSGGDAVDGDALGSRSDAVGVEAGKAPKSTKLTIVDVEDAPEGGVDNGSDSDGLPPLEEIDLKTGAVSAPSAPVGELLEGGALKAMVQAAHGKGTPRRIQIVSDNEVDSDDED